MASMLRQFRMSELFTENPRHSSRRFTMVVPSNAAWERARTSFSKAFNTIQDGQFPDYVSCNDILTLLNDWQKLLRRLRIVYRNPE